MTKMGTVLPRATLIEWRNRLRHLISRALTLSALIFGLGLLPFKAVTDPVNGGNRVESEFRQLAAQILDVAVDRTITDYAMVCIKRANQLVA
jgi:hypothetical protein